MEISEYYSNIYSHFGNITRARGPFLYTQKNIRLTDLYREDGRAVLGWDFSARTVFKNNISKSLTGSFMTSGRAQLEKAVGVLLNSKRRIFLFAKRADAGTAALSFNAESVCHYKSFSPELDYSKIQAVILEPPLPWTNNFFILAVPADGGATENFFPRGQDVFAGALLAAASRAIYDLIASQKNLSEKDFFIYDTVLKEYFERRGVRLKCKIPEANYDAFILHCMNLGILINPDFNRDSFVPLGADAGVLNKLKAEPFCGEKK